MADAKRCRAIVRAVCTKLVTATSLKELLTLPPTHKLGCWARFIKTRSTQTTLVTSRSTGLKPRPVIQKNWKQFQRFFAVDSLRIKLVALLCSLVQ